MNRPPKRHIALRIAENDLELIDRLAEQHGLTRTDYMVRASTGELRDPIDLEARFASSEDRLERLEQLAFGV